MIIFTQQVMMRMRAEDPEPGGVDHAFRAGQVYGVSCVLNHLFDSLRDPNGSDLAVLDEFSDQMHDEILSVLAFCKTMLSKYGFSEIKTYISTQPEEKFVGSPDQWRDAEKAIDQIHEKFGTQSIGAASTLSETGLRPKEKGSQQWGPSSD